MEKIIWNWINFWGTSYRVYDKDKNKIKEILIYKKRIYILEENK